MKKEIKKQARELYSAKEYDLALTTIFKLDSVETESFLIKESTRDKWFQDFSFCNSIAKNDELFKRLLSISRVDELLYKHFLCNWHDSHAITPIPFQLKIAQQSPKLFVRMLRVSQAFLNNKWYTKGNIDQYSEYIKNHSLVWKHLFDYENRLWSELLKQFDNCISEDNPSNILANMAVIIELEHLEDTSNAHLQFLSQVYNTFISTLLARLPKNYTFDGKQKLFFKKIVKTQKIALNIQSLYQSIANWQTFINNHVNPYCFDLKIEPSNENKIISYNRSSEDFYKWKLDGIRYEINRLDYFEDAKQTAKRNYNRIANIQNEFSLYEYSCQLDYLAIDSFLQDLKLSKFPMGNNLDSIRFYQPIIAASNYYKMLYNNFNQLYQKNKNWFVAYQKLKNDSPNLYETENFPFIQSTIEKLYKIHDGQSKRENDFITPKTVLAQPYTYKAHTGKNFNRFNINYNVFKKPFLQIGNYIFTPTLFFTKQDWFYVTIQNALERLSKDNKLRKDTSTAMETDLKRLFEKAGFKAEIYKGYEFSNSEGDIDIKATDGKDTILIQLKRTKLRLNLKDAYFEYVQTDSKASRQINNVVEHFSSQNGEIYKWIVTTSFENAYTMINDCLKVNYFDLKIILRSFEYIKNSSIHYLNERITSDSQIKDVLQCKAILHPENLDMINFIMYKNAGLFDTVCPLINHFQKYEDINLPIPIADPQEYREACFDSNNTTSSYIRTYKKALDEDKKGNHSKAKELLKICLDQHPNDFDALAALANVFANMKHFIDAFTFFKKALNIYPNDLFVSRNYALALMEAGEKEEAFKVYAQIKEKYWFVDIQFLGPIKNMPQEIIEKYYL